MAHITWQEMAEKIKRAVDRAGKSIEDNTQLQEEEDWWNMFEDLVRGTKIMSDDYTPTTISNQG